MKMLMKLLFNIIFVVYCCYCYELKEIKIQKRENETFPHFFINKIIPTIDNSGKGQREERSSFVINFDIEKKL
jgi:hypothetical protein